MREFPQKVLFILVLLDIGCRSQQVCSQSTNYGYQIGLCKCPPTSSLINGQCKTCTVSNCLLCSVSNANQCDVCKAGFVLDQLTKSSCYLATNPSLTCTSQACACSAYQVYKDGYCVSCQAKNCLLCSLNDPQQCDVCQKGYVLDSLTKTECVPQQNFTLTCLSNSCSCSPFQVNINGVCTDCKASNCLLCSATDATECDVCKNGYVLDTLTKKTCVLKTNTSLSCNLGSCGCSLFQVSVNGICTTCQVTNCKLCSVANPFQCDICNNGYILDALTKSQCYLQSNPSLSCVQNSCQCDPFQAKVNGVCTSCEVSNCLLCSWNNSKQCDICRSGYILDSLSKTACLLPQNSSLTCNQNSVTCACSPYEVNINGICTVCKSQNCRLCSATDPMECDICLTSYTYNSSTKSCDPPKCSAPNMIWVNNECQCNKTVSFLNAKGECEIINNSERIALALSISLPIVLLSLGIVVVSYFNKNFLNQRAGVEVNQISAQTPANLRIEQ